jgi:hypothetical protein
MTQHRTRLARLEAQAAQAAAAPLSHEALQAHFWEAAQAIVRDGMPEEFARPVVDELRAGTPPEAQSPLTRQVVSLAWHGAYAEDCPNPYRGPLVIPREYCELLTGPQAADVAFTSLACATCHLAAPYYYPRERPRDWVTTSWFTCCQRCGGALAWPAGWHRHTIKEED